MNCSLRLICFDGYSRDYGEGYNYDLAAWYDGQVYTAKTFHRLLEATNDMTTIPEEKRELVAKAVILLTLPDYFGEEITLSNLRQKDNLGWTLGPEFEYNYILGVWTKLGGRKLSYRFYFDK